MNVTNSGLYLVLVVNRWMASGLQAVLPGSLRSNLPVSLVLEKDVGRIGFRQAVLPRYSSLRLSSFIASGPSLLVCGQEASN